MQRVTIGSLVMAIGVIHNAVGVLLGWPYIAEVLADGYVAAVPDTAPWRMAIFWFLWFGWLAILLGMAWHTLDRRGHPVPLWQVVGFGLVGLLGALAMPASGFWLVLPVVGLACWRSWGTPRPRATAAAD